MPLTVLVIEDHPIVIAGCRATFSNAEEIALIEATTVADGLKQYRERRPDVAVIDINLPDGSGLDLASQILSEKADAKIVIFSMSDAPALAVRAIDIGAKGYVSKTGDPNDLRAAVLAVQSGKIWLPADLTQQMALLRTGPRDRVAQLSDRELQVLRGIARGRSLAEIAEDIGIAYKTAAMDCNAMRAKFNARTTSELVRLAVEQRLV